MHAGNNDDEVGVDAVEDSIGEPTEQRASRISMSYWIHGRMSCNTFAGCLDGIQKLIPQARTLPLIPKKRVFNIGRRRRADKDGYHGLWLRTR